MPRPLYIVDAFADRPFAGNPAAVVLLEPEDGPATDEYLQSVAAEMNLSETAFVSFDESTGPNRFGLRWFTPRCEVELCGHATLAAAQTLYDAAKVNLHTPILFDTKCGLLRAAPAPDFRIGPGPAGGFTLDFPATPPVEVEPPAALIDVLGLTGRVRFAGQSAYDWLLVVDSPADVRALAPDFDDLAVIGGRGTIVSAAADGADAEAGYDVVSRCFYPAVGVDEDPVTGSAHCAIGPYFARVLAKETLLCRQASTRGGALQVRVEGDRAYLTGQARSVLRGELLV